MQLEEFMKYFDLIDEGYANIAEMGGKITQQLIMDDFNTALSSAKEETDAEAKNYHIAKCIYCCLIIQRIDINFDVLPLAPDHLVKFAECSENVAKEIAK